MLDLIDQIVESFEVVREAACKLDTDRLITFEKERESQLVSTLILFILNGISV